MLNSSWAVMLGFSTGRFGQRPQPVVGGALGLRNFQDRSLCQIRLFPLEVRRLGVVSLRYIPHWGISAFINNQVFNR